MSQSEMSMTVIFCSFFIILSQTIEMKLLIYHPQYFYLQYQDMAQEPSTKDLLQLILANQKKIDAHQKILEDNQQEIKAHRKILEGNQKILEDNQKSIKENIQARLFALIYYKNQLYFLMNVQEDNPNKPAQELSFTANMSKVREILKDVAGFSQEELKSFNEAISDPKLNRVLGAIFGAMIGDALGAYCQFMNKIPPHIEAEVMNMPGGGTFEFILPGQYTDDNELAYHLLQGLLQFDQTSDLQSQKSKIIKHIALEYIRWVANGPFDIGGTCSSAIGYLTENKSKIEQSGDDPKIMNKLLKYIGQFNSYSQSNGSLMRIVPMAAFISLLQLNPIQEIQFIIDQIRLTHPNVFLQTAGLCWVLTLSLLINRDYSDKESFADILKSVENQRQFQLLKEWFTEAHQCFQGSMPGNQSMGWAKIAFSYGLKFLAYLSEEKLSLQNKDLYKDWIKKVIMIAGDTDTNACISGGLIGSIIGFQELPIQYLEKIFKVQYKVKEPNTSMAWEYEPANFLRCVLKLIGKCKSHLQIQTSNIKKEE